MFLLLIHTQYVAKTFHPACERKIFFRYVSSSMYFCGDKQQLPHTKSSTGLVSIRIAFCSRRLESSLLLKVSPPKSISRAFSLSWFCWFIIYYLFPSPTHWHFQLLFCIYKSSCSSQQDMLLNCSIALLVRAVYTNRYKGLSLIHI